ncbi:MAG: hypothetical protein U5Q03_10095 [Bacteroidota bacterium]|nr:hypothetical protein [Bacteroidota bacterium]
MKTSLFYFQTIVASLLFAFYPNISNSQTPCFNCLSNGNSANDFAFATGKDNSANGISSFSAGYLNSSFGEYSFAIGYENNASGYASISIGRLSESYGNYSLALGAECRTNTLSYAFGQNAQAIAHQSMAIGRNVKSSASNAITIGCSSSD